MKVGEDGVVMMLVKPVEGLKTIAGGIDLVALTRMSASSSRRTSPSSTTRMRFCPIVFEKVPYVACVAGDGVTCASNA